MALDLYGLGPGPYGCLSVRSLSGQGSLAALAFTLKYAEALVYSLSRRSMGS
jgi:hypothetical protein